MVRPERQTSCQRKFQKGCVAGSFLTHAAVKFSPWDTMAGKSVEFFALTDPRPTVEITNFGAHIVSIGVSDRNGLRASMNPRLHFQLGQLYRHALARTR